MVGNMKEKEKIGIIGYGVVGQGIGKLFGEAIIDDINTHQHSEKEFKDLFQQTKFIVVSVPTPSREDGSCDISAVADALKRIAAIKYEGIVLIKSTIVPGEIEKFLQKYSKLRLVISPEFIGESKYFTPFWKYPDPEDIRSHTWQIFGGKKKDTSLCVDLFKKKMSVDTAFIQTDIMTAALTKYMENCFFATKVTFCNEWYDIAKQYGVDYNELRECWLADPRINRNHTLVFPDDRGYGGRCFPKDVKAMIADLKDRGFNSNLLKAVNLVNKKIRK